MAPAAAPATTSVPSVAAIAVVARRPVRETHGLALAAGFGITFGLLGLQARYDIPLRPWLTVSPFISGGVMFGALRGPYGASVAFGQRHRLAVDLSVGPVASESLSLHGKKVDERTVYGPIAAVGYEHMSDGGWFQRATIEYAHQQWGSAGPIQSPHIVFSGFAFGRRIW